MTIKEFFSFKHNALLWGNLIAMVAVAALLLIGVMKWLDSYTHHGVAVMVPEVNGMAVSEARQAFASQGLQCIVADSVYRKEKPAGVVLDCTPTSGQKVKRGRTVYLTINTLQIPLQDVPDVADNSSLRQAEALVRASGFKLDSVQYIPGEKDWVYGVKYKDRMLQTGEKVPVGATLTLVAGDGGEIPAEEDSLESTTQTAVPARQETEESGDSWF